MKQRKRTKIVCTIGPSSNDLVILKKMIQAGMNVARLNFSHGEHKNHAELIQLIRRASEETNEPIAILQDLQGPKVRVGELPNDGIALETGKLVVFSTEKNVSLPKIGLTYDALHNDVQPGDRLLLDDGLLEVKIVSVAGLDIQCEVMTGGTLFSHKGLNLPTATLGIPAITEKDKKDMRFGILQGVDLVALSFVRNAQEIRDLRCLIESFEEESVEKSKYHSSIQIIAKIEKHEAVKNIDEIIEAADGIMIARGDLGIEMPAEEVPLIQKVVIDKCRKKAKPVIVATQMLDSMIRNPRPTRAEVSDVANAVIDHTDAVMLSGESATGKFPVETVETMSRIIHETEESRFDDVTTAGQFNHEDAGLAISELANFLARDIKAKLILVASISDRAGQIVSCYRPERPIFVPTLDDRGLRQSNLSWGVQPFMLPKCSTTEELIDHSIGFFKKTKWVKSGDKIIVVAGESADISSKVNSIEIREV
ncbi:pyruvate kinase [Patescibacteria group bacterium]|nr:pyruvate kinase [Patescibacteria group bacterium]MBU1028702.1 pyruvate kinase [Patescibacteria group bacterium]MBU1915970.1 pyruvate kinase [Patescibacteria group bacterium]